MADDSNANYKSCSVPEGVVVTLADKDWKQESYARSLPAPADAAMKDAVNIWISRQNGDTGAMLADYTADGNGRYATDGNNNKFPVFSGSEPSAGILNGASKVLNDIGVKCMTDKGEVDFSTPAALPTLQDLKTLTRQ